MYTIDIDTGGTMTDCLVRGEDRQITLKVDTTPHDFTISFHNCLERAADELDFASVRALLRETALIRWTSTITTNVLAERRGAKVGLVVSPGHEETLYGDARSPVVDELVETGNIISLPDVRDEEAVLAAVKQLLENGARRICVSLKDNFPSNADETALKWIIEDQYPDHIIGSVPVLLGSEMAQIPDNQTRTHYSLMNAYTHTHLANSLFKAEDDLREKHGWPGALLIGHTSGGVARIGKTKAVDTIESGPVFGTFGAAFVARQYGIDDVVCLDVGGTTTKASVVKAGSPVFKRGGELMEIPVGTSFALLRSAALGGGSVARVRDGTLTLGPDSMGAAPGPVCYGLGGSEPTLTDALLVMGYLDPNNFLGGRRKLDVERSRAVIEEKIAWPLSVDFDRAASMIRDEAIEQMATLLEHTLAEAGMDPENCTLFAYGGNGALFGATVAEAIGAKSAFAFDIGPVFSTFGSANSNVVHTYEHGLGANWARVNGDQLIHAADQIYRQACRDLDGEGFDASEATFTYEIETADHQGANVSFASSEPPGAAWLESSRSAVLGGGIGDSEEVFLVSLKAEFEVGKPFMVKLNRRGNPETTTRDIRFRNGLPVPATIARWESLGVSDRLEGPAVVNGDTLTCTIPPDWRAVVDEYGNLRMNRA